MYAPCNLGGPLLVGCGRVGNQWRLPWVGQMSEACETVSGRAVFKTDMAHGPRCAGTVVGGVMEAWQVLNGRFAGGLECPPLMPELEEGGEIPHLPELNGLLASLPTVSTGCGEDHPRS